MPGLATRSQRAENMIGVVSKVALAGCATECGNECAIRWPGSFRFLRFAGQRFVQVAINDIAVASGAHDDLVEINVLRKRGKRFSGFRGGKHFEGGTQVKFADLDAVLAQAGERF